MRLKSGDEQTEKTGVMVPAEPDKSGADGAHPVFNVSITRLAQKDNTPDILKYLPDGLLSKEQMVKKGRHFSILSKNQY